MSEEKNKDYGDIGLFRYGIIAPIITGTHGFKSVNAYLESMSKKEYDFEGKKYYFSKSALKKWYLEYQRKGFISLQQKKRNDVGKSRKLSEEAIEKIISLRNEYPSITGTNIYKILNKEGYIRKKEVSLNALLYYLRKNNLKANYESGIERRSFEHLYANDSWQADTSHGPYLTIGGKKYKTYIIMFIDDKSRLITGIDVFLNDNAINMQSVFKEAVKTYGVPKQLFVDNGGPYANKQLSLICANLGVKLIHARVFSGASKGKCERMFKTIKDGWMRIINWNEFKSLDDIRGSLRNFLLMDYLNKIHSITKQTPNERWHEDFEKISFLLEEIIDIDFLHQERRKVRKDRTITLNNKIYEVPYKYVGQSITVKYDPLNTNLLWVLDNGKLESTNLLNKNENAKVKRKTNIDYSKVINKDLDVKEWNGK